MIRVLAGGTVQYDVFRFHNNTPSMFAFPIRIKLSHAVAQIPFLPHIFALAGRFPTSREYINFHALLFRFQTPFSHCLIRTHPILDSGNPFRITY